MLLDAPPASRLALLERFIFVVVKDGGQLPLVFNPRDFFISCEVFPFLELWCCHGVNLG